MCRQIGTPEAGDDSGWLDALARGTLLQIPGRFSLPEETCKPQALRRFANNGPQDGGRNGHRTEGSQPFGPTTRRRQTTEAMLTLTYFKLCPKSRSVRIALGELGLEARLVEENPWAPSRRMMATNPAGSLPMLHLHDGDVLIGWYSISEFFDDARRDSGQWARLAGPDLPMPSHGGPVWMVPGDAEERAEVRRLIAWFHEKCDQDVTQELLHEKVRVAVHRERKEAPNLQFLRAAQANLRYQMSYLGLLADQRRWIAGDVMSFADIAAAAHVSVADFLGEIAWQAYPHAKTWYMRIKSRKSMRALLADKVPGLHPPPHYADLDF